MPTDQLAAADTSPPAVERPRVLFVDDDEMVLQALRRMMQALSPDWEMEFAKGGPQAIDLIDHTQYHAVISDIRMPVIDGFAVLQHARRRSPHMACMLLSGAYDTATLPDDLASTVEIVNKPCSGKALKAAVDGLLATKLA